MSQSPKAPPKVAGLSVRFDAGGLSIIESEYTRPIFRAGRMFKGVWAFLDEFGAADWDRIHSIADHFHPAYMRDPDTGALTPGRAPGSAVFDLMEKGEYSEPIVRLVAPTIWAALERSGATKSRARGGVPDMFRYYTLHVSAMLACHEYERLDFEVQQDAPNREAIARHLYYFERFVSLWRRVGTDKPKAWEVNQAKRAKARAWVTELAAFHEDRVRSQAPGTPKPTMKASARLWVMARKRRGIDVPDEDRAYLELRGAARAAAKPKK